MAGVSVPTKIGRTLTRSTVRSPTRKNVGVEHARHPGDYAGGFGLGDRDNRQLCSAIRCNHRHTLVWMKGHRAIAADSESCSRSCRHNSGCDDGPDIGNQARQVVIVRRRTKLGEHRRHRRLSRRPLKSNAGEHPQQRD